METRFQFHAADGVGQDGVGVGVHYGVDAGIFLEDLAVDAAFEVSFRYAVLDGRGIFDVVFDYVARGRDEGGGNGVRKEKSVWIGGIAQGYVAVGIEDMVIVEDVVGCYEIFQGRWVLWGHW